MDPARRTHRPSLRAPRALLAWEGWNDACDAASGALAFLLGQHEDTTPFATIEPEEFYDFQVRRPIVSVSDGGHRTLSWPTTSFFDLVLPDSPHDLVAVTGEEPSLRWKTYTRTVAQLLGETDVEMAVTLGAFIGQVAHTQPVPIVGVATDPALVERHGLLTSEYEGPTGIVGVMLEACREVGIPTVSLWAATPHYLAANPNPKAMLALLSRAAAVLDIEVDTAELGKVADEFESRVDEAMAENDEFVEYVGRLEAESEAVMGAEIDPGDSARLISEIESFLRTRED